MKKPTVLMILDGYGLNERKDHNAVAEANTPVMDKLMAECPFVKGNASGLAVGLPEGQMGNSEVGHMNMGAGRIVYQDLTRITKEIQDGSFFENPALLEAVNNCKKNDSAQRNGLSKVYVHCFLDGRDTPPTSGKEFAEELETEMKKLGVGQIASVMGRYYAMDRDNNYDRVKLAFDALTRGEGLTAASATEGIQASYDRDETDEFVKPTVIVKDGRPVATIKDKDSVIFVQEKLPERFVMMTSKDLKGQGDSILLMYVSRIMIRPSRTSWLHSRRLRLQILLVNGCRHII